MIQYFVSSFLSLLILNFFFKEKGKENSEEERRKIKKIKVGKQTS